MCFGFLFHLRRPSRSCIELEKPCTELKDTPPPGQCKMYDEQEIAEMLKGQVKRLCNYFQNEIPRKEHTEALKAIITKNKARRAAKLDDEAVSTSIPESELQPQTSKINMVNRSDRKAIGIIDLAQHLSGHRSNSKVPMTEKESLSYLEKEGISYQNVLMVAESDEPEIPTKQVFNWKSAMKAMCSDTESVDALLLETLPENTFSIYIPLPFESSMREFLRSCGFVIDESGLPVTGNEECMEYDAVQFYITPSPAPKQEKPHEVEVCIKTGPVVTEISQCSENPEVYDIVMNKVTTEPDLVPEVEEDEFERAISGDLSIPASKPLEGIDRLAEDIFSNSHPENIYRVIEEMRKLMPDECDGRDAEPGEISSGRCAKNAESFGWFLKQMDTSETGIPDTADLEMVDDTLEAPGIGREGLDSFSWRHDIAPGDD